MPLYAWGANSSGQLGIGRETEAEWEAEEVVVPLQEGEVVDMMAGGGSHTLLLTTTGRLLGCGSNTSGQLGLGREVQTQATFGPLPSLPSEASLVSLAAGWDFSLLLDSEGGVWAAGSNAWGQLGTSRGHSNPPQPRSSLVRRLRSDNSKLRRS